jgi:hypothetical protein
MKYTRTGKTILFASMLAFLVADTLAVSGTCDSTPRPSQIGIVVGLVFQCSALAAIAFSMQYFSVMFQPARPASFSHRGKAIGMALIFCVLSVLLFRQSVLYSDTLSSRGATSAGEKCLQKEP